MITGQGRCKVFAVQAVVCLLVVFLSINFFVAQRVSGGNAVGDNPIGITGDSRKSVNVEALSPYRTMPDVLRQRMEKGNGIRGRGIDVRFPQGGMGKTSGRYESDVPQRPLPAKKFVNEGIKGENTADLTWNTEAVDAPKYFDQFSSRAIAVDASGHPHVVYGGDHLYYAYYDGTAWHYETVDSSPYVGNNASVALDKSGYVHISYVGERSSLTYATNESGKWESVIVDSSGRPFVCSMALDASGRAHIGYSGYPNIVMYATNVTGSWITAIVSKGYSSRYELPSDISIAVDASAKAHICYASAVLGDIYFMYASNASGAWVLTTVDSCSDDGRGSIAVDNAGNVHISYDSADGLKYVTNALGSWVITTVDSTDYEDKYPSIALDTSGNAHISYLGGVYGSLYVKYATNISGAWITTKVDGVGQAEGTHSSIALDTSGHAHISYINDFTLKCATNASGLWVISSVDSLGSVGQCNSLALDTSGHAHISYYDSLNSSLKYATNASGLWVTAVVYNDRNGYHDNNTSLALDAAGYVYIIDIDRDETLNYSTNASGEWVTVIVDRHLSIDGASLAIDSTGHAHISFCSADESKRSLKYATNVSGSWVNTTVDNRGGTGRTSSIALDKEGCVHISYYCNGLMYATNASGRWLKTTVDRHKNAGVFTSLCLDKEGIAHISYSDGSLWYATKASRRWVKTLVDKNGDNGWPWYGVPSLALDSKGKAHISYSTGNATIKYTTNATGAWENTTLCIGVYHSLALNADDVVHISYYDYSTFDLLYTTGVNNKVGWR